MPLVLVEERVGGPPVSRGGQKNDWVSERLQGVKPIETQ